MSELKITSLLGLTMTSVEQNGRDAIVFTATTGAKYKLFHEQDCCETVEIEDVNGELSDLVGAPILLAEEVSSTRDDGAKARDDGRGYTDESFTWTFYKLATVKGYVTIRWYGNSNGYYSERVDFAKFEDEYAGWRTW